MRILIANEALSGGGGVESYLSALVSALQAAGHEIGILHDNPASEPGPQRIASEATWRTSVRDEGIDRVLARVHGFAPDVCFSHNMSSLEIDARLLDEFPVVKMMHGHFGTCVSGQKAFAFPGVTACTRDFGPGCLMHYLPRRCGQMSPLVMMKQYAWGSDQRALFDRYRAVVVASRFMREEYLRAGVAADRVHAVPLFAPPASTRAAAPDGHSRPIDVAFLGRMTSLKGPAVLLQAAGHAARRLDRRLSIVLGGEGPELAHLRARAASYRIDARFPGWVQAEERDRLLRGSQLIAVPSL
ncbi:MAG TPA: glycosyltransferase family 4 protein, partial [Vicinamibacterales bacterium]|nr:glycosyltransferase family 4 protein [Vicinamibacterales bacterium]